MTFTHIASPSILTGAAIANPTSGSSQKITAHVQASNNGTIFPGGIVKSGLSALGSNISKIDKKAHLTLLPPKSVIFSPKNECPIGSLRVWQHFFPEIEHFAMHNSAATKPLFTNQQDADDFDTWMDEYLKKFTTNPDAIIPLPDGGHYPHMVYFSAIDPLEPWLWIMANCSAEVRHLAGWWFFEDEEDATIFKIYAST